MATDPVETFADGDFVHLHDSGDPDPAWRFADVLVADEPIMLVATPRGVASVPARRIYRAAMTFDGPVCFDCRRRLRERLIGE